MKNNPNNKYLKIIKKVLPYEKEVYLKEFKNTCALSPLTALAPKDFSTEYWFNLFKETIKDAINQKKFLPICRFGDGEFIFLNNGIDIIDYRIKWIDKLKIVVRNFLTRLNLINFTPFTVNKYTSGSYKYSEIKSLNNDYKKNIQFILENGIFCSTALIAKNPFSERFFKLFVDLLRQNQIKIHSLNYVPFIFVYALFSGKSKFEILNKKRILIINSFNSLQKIKIINKLKSFGAKEISFINISSNRSAYDKIEISNKMDIDLVLIGAGVGKLFLYKYLIKLNVPCIDIGYIFQTWLDPKSETNRAFCSSKDEYDEN